MTEFRTDAVFEALRQPLALVDDADRRQAFERYVEAARFPLERAVFDLLSSLVAAVDSAVQERYRVRLTYRGGALELHVDPVAVSSERSVPPPEPAPGEWTFSDGEMEKITIRIPGELKDVVTRAASSAGLSANSWFVRALSRSVSGSEERGRTRAFGADLFRPDGDENPPGSFPFGMEPPAPPRPPEPPAGPPRGHGGSRLQGWIGE